MIASDDSCRDRSVLLREALRYILTKPNPLARIAISRQQPRCVMQRSVSSGSPVAGVSVNTAVASALKLPAISSSAANHASRRQVWRGRARDPRPLVIDSQQHEFFEQAHIS
jgi:hypothetical protein